MAKIDDILLSSQTTLEIARMLLTYVFVSWNALDCLFGEKNIRKFLIVDFYQLLLEKQDEYFEGMQDYTKNADEHFLLQNNIKKIDAISIALQKKEYHDEVIYLMNILS